MSSKFRTLPRVFHHDKILENEYVHFHTTVDFRHEVYHFESVRMHVTDRSYTKLYEILLAFRLGKMKNVLVDHPNTKLDIGLLIFRLYKFLDFLFAHFQSIVFESHLFFRFDSILASEDCRF